MDAFSVITCPEPTLVNGKVILTNLTYGNTARYECDVGYILENGDNDRMCGEDGDWTGIQPTCDG